MAILNMSPTEEERRRRLAAEGLLATGSQQAPQIPITPIPDGALSMTPTAPSTPEGVLSMTPQATPIPEGALSMQSVQPFRFDTGIIPQAPTPRESIGSPQRNNPSNMTVDLSEGLPRDRAPTDWEIQTNAFRNMTPIPDQDAPQMTPVIRDRLAGEGLEGEALEVMTQVAADTEKRRGSKFVGSPEFYMGLLRGGAALMSGGNLGDAFNAIGDAAQGFRDAQRIKWERKGDMMIGYDQDGQVVDVKRVDEITAIERDNANFMTEKERRQLEREEFESYELGERKTVVSERAQDQTEVEQDRRFTLDTEKEIFDQGYKTRNQETNEAQIAAAIDNANAQTAIEAASKGVILQDQGSFNPSQVDNSGRIPGDSYGRMLVKLESSGNPRAKAPTSSARGAHQFTDDTWVSTVRKANPEWARGLTDAQLKQPQYRNDPTKSAQMEMVLRNENASHLTSKGAAINPANLYAAHHFGAGRGATFGRASGDTRMENILSPEQIKANAYLRGKTKNQVLKIWADRAGMSVAELTGAAGGVPSGNPLTPSRTNPALEAMRRGRPTAQLDPTSPVNQPKPAEPVRLSSEDNKELNELNQRAESARMMQRKFNEGLSDVINFNAGKAVDPGRQANILKSITPGADDNTLEGLFKTVNPIAIGLYAISDKNQIGYLKSMERLKEIGRAAELRLNKGVQTEGDAQRAALTQIDPSRPLSHNIAIMEQMYVDTALTAQIASSKTRWAATTGGLNTIDANGLIFNDIWSVESREITERAKSEFRQMVKPFLQNRGKPRAQPGIDGRMTGR